MWKTMENKANKARMVEIEGKRTEKKNKERKKRI